MTALIKTKRHILSNISLNLMIQVLALSFTSSLWAADSYRVNNTTTETISEHSECRQVTNNSGNDLFVPTRTAAEWTAFRDNLPTGVSLAACPACSVNEVFATSGTFTVPAGCDEVRIQAWGGGGGGGGAGGGKAEVGGGGGYSEVIVTALSAGETFAITIGQGGGGGGAGAGTGGVGGHSGGTGGSATDGSAGAGAGSGGAGGAGSGAGTAGGAGAYGGGGGGGNGTASHRGGGGGGSTLVVQDTGSVTRAIAGGGGGGGGAATGGAGGAGPGGPGCSIAGGAASGDRGGGGGGGACVGTTTTNGSGVTPGNQAGLPTTPVDYSTRAAGGGIGAIGTAGLVVITVP